MALEASRPDRYVTWSVADLIPASPAMPARATSRTVPAAETAVARAIAGPAEAAVAAALAAASAICLAELALAAAVV